MSCKKLTHVVTASALLVLWSAAAGAATDAQKCEAAKLKRAGQYNFCRLKAEGKAVKTGDPADYTKCDLKLAGKWADAELIPMCPTTGDVASIQTQVTADADFIALKVAGVRFVDNLDGTVTDTQTGLMWEKKQNLDSIVEPTNPLDADNTYTWADAMSEFLSLLNGYSADETTQTGLLGHSDWRIPTIAELQTIVDLTATGCGTSGPCIFSALGPTVRQGYWSSTTNSDDPTAAVYVYFGNGLASNNFKSDPQYVRAVRGGL